VTTTKKAAAPAATTAKVEPIVATGDLDITLPPKPTRAGNGKGKYPFDTLEVGKFFSVKNKTRRDLYTAVNNANKRYRKELPATPGNPPQVIVEREFYAVDVDAATAEALKGSAHEGATVLIIRSK
jgi:hypothetical protein